MIVLFYLIVAHAAIDYPLQGDTTAREKNPNSTSELQKHVPFYYWMTAHCLMHGGAVTLITGDLGLGLLETVVHWVTDYLKCMKIISIHADQMIHIVCKVCWYYLYLSFKHAL